MGVGVVGRQAEVLASLHDRQSSTVVVSIGDAVVVVEQAGAHRLQAAGGAGTGGKWTQAGKRARGERRRAGTASGGWALPIELARDPLGKYGNNWPRIRVRGVRRLVCVPCVP